jgi:hypothetical protein
MTMYSNHLIRQMTAAQTNDRLAKAERARLAACRPGRRAPRERLEASRRSSGRRAGLLLLWPARRWLGL